MSKVTHSDVLQRIEVVVSALDQFERIVTEFQKGIVPEQVDLFEYRDLPYLVSRACRLKTDLDLQRWKME